MKSFCGLARKCRPFAELPAWQDELKTMLHNDSKADIEALYTLYGPAAVADLLLKAVHGDESLEG